MMDISSSSLTGSVVPSVSKSSRDSSLARPVSSAGVLPSSGQDSLPSESSPAVVPSRPSPEELQNLVEKVNASFSNSTSNLKFSVAEGTDISVIRIEDAETGELIRQIPSEEMVAIAQALENLQQGMMLEERA